MSTYAARLQSFIGHWDDNLTSGRQLAAMGHVCDRPPLESFEEGSRCIGCEKFVPKAVSIGVLESLMTQGDDRRDGRLSLHIGKCNYLQLRFPFEDLRPDIGQYNFAKMRDRWEQRSGLSHAPLPVTAQTSGLFTLPPELRLQIYSYIIPPPATATKIVPLNRDSHRMVIERTHRRHGTRDLTLSRVLVTCKAIKDETLDLLFHNITYSFNGTRDLYLFLRQIGRTGRQLLVAVDVVCGQRCDAIAFALLASCDRLDAITLRFERPKLISDGAPLWITNGVQTLLELSGLKEVHVNWGQAGQSLRGQVWKDLGDTDIVRTALMRS